MHKKFTKISVVSTALCLAIAGSATVFALPAQSTLHAQTNYSSNVSGSAYSSVGRGNSNHVSVSASAQTKGSANAAAGKLRACKNRENAVKNIMLRIDTRANNQIKLFSTIATRVEAFYVKQGKTLSNYAQLVASVNTAKTQAVNEFAVVKTNSSFKCSSAHPKGEVNAFQSYLKTEISYLKSFKTAVKNLIVGVASVNGVKVSASAQSSSNHVSATGASN